MPATNPFAPMCPVWAVHELDHYESDEPTSLGCAVRAVCVCGWTTSTHNPNDWMLREHETPAWFARRELYENHTGMAQVPIGWVPMTDSGVSA